MASSTLTPDQIAMAKFVGYDISVYNISKPIPLRQAYRKYQAFHAIQAKKTATPDGDWPFSHLNKDHTIELFVGSTTWYEKYVKCFEKAQEYKRAMDWLEEKEGCLTDQALFGSVKLRYTFTDMWAYFDASDKRKKRKQSIGEDDKKKKSKKQKKQ